MKFPAIVLFVLGTLQGYCLAQTKTPSQPGPAGEIAPLPDKVIAARTVFLINETGKSKLGDSMYALLKKWNRWQVVTDRAKADLVLVVNQRDSVEGVVSTASSTATGQTATGTGISVPIKTSAWYLHVVDANSGERLWTVETTMGGKLWRSWGSIAKSLLADVQRRLK